jgi:response regulator RpfG family c-di-GMP phosphodiesterase
MAAEHYEKFKGGGYPSVIEGEEIHCYARIWKISDVYDTLIIKKNEQ